MFGISKVMIFIAIIISSLLYWATSNVCRYNFTIKKKTNQLKKVYFCVDNKLKNLAKKSLTYFFRLDIYFMSIFKIFYLLYFFVPKTPIFHFYYHYPAKKLAKLYLKFVTIIFGILRFFGCIFFTT